jgi:hypothetical protein
VSKLKVISGGQTGVDRAALDVALKLGLPCGGWCPKGRRAEDGTIPRKYPLEETPSWVYPQRTEWNVRDSDGTLILTRTRLRGGTALTVNMAKRLGKPWLLVDLFGLPDLQGVRDWLERKKISVLNVAGPRESETPGIYNQATRWLSEFLAILQEA